MMQIHWSLEQQIVEVYNNKSKKSPSKKNPAKESVVINNDYARYEVDNTHEPALEQWGVSEVNATMGNTMNLTEDCGVSKNHHLGYEEHVRGLGS